MISKISALVAAAALGCGAAQASPAVQATLTLGNNTQGIATDPALARAYVTNHDSGTVSVIDMNALTVVATIPVTANPRRIIADAATHRVYLTHGTATNTQGVVTVIDGTSNTVVTTIPVGNDPGGIASNFFIHQVYVTNGGSNNVSVIDATANAVIATIPVGTGPSSPTSNDTLKKLYVVSNTDNTVTSIDEQALAVVKTIGVGKGPITPAIDAQHAKVYVNNQTDKTISVIDSTTDTVTGLIPSGAGISASGTANFMVISSVYHRGYLPNGTDNTLTIVDTDNDTVTHTVPVGTTPLETIVDANGGNVYVVNQGSNSVSILSAATETVIDSLAVGGAPWRMLDGLDHVFVLNTNGSSADSVTIAAEENTLAETAIATEFYEADFNHYFNTADEVETRLLVDGVFGDGWHRTFAFFRVWTVPGPGRVAMCRFFSATFGTLSSHFYTFGDECQTLQSDPTFSAVWVLETAAAYYLMPTDATGNCPAGTAPLFRVYNNGMGGAPNHRLTGDEATRDLMITLGWSPEGNGPLIIFACTPTLLNG
ncbi:MAG TPA: YncE family protein [Casimicrobiaceae bacterium]|nr:YncE family protein [Casimicrobiaceae bacterium]